MGQPFRFRTRILGVGVSFVLITTLCGGFAYWVAAESRYLFVRGQLAHDVTTQYYKLNAQAYALFKQHMDQLLLGASANQSALLGKQAAIGETFDTLRRLIGAEVAFVGEEEKAEEIQELAVLADLERQLHEISQEFDRLHNVRAIDRANAVRFEILRTLEDSIDNRFRSLIRTAIAEEEQERREAEDAALARNRRLAQAAQLTVALAVVVGGAGILLLSRGLRRPLDHLLAATRALRRGDLHHRVPVSGAREFVLIAESFNEMASRIEDQRAALERSQQSLERTVAERTEELRQANEALGRVDRLRRRFFADISHELRTPLTVIRGESQVALRGGDKPVGDYKEALERIHDQARQLSRLVDDLLYIARADANAARVQWEAVALDSLLAGVCEDLEIIASRQQVEIRFDCGVSAATTRGDPGRLTQLFAILIDNAIHYSHPGGVVGVHLAAGVTGLWVSVSDTGIGIAPEDRELIFERFYRGRNAASRRRDGSGLGLPVAAAIVKAHGGQIRVDSVLGEGSCFTVLLPGVERVRAVA